MEKVVEQLLFTLEEFLWMWGILQMGLVKNKRRWTLGGILFVIFLAGKVGARLANMPCSLKLHLRQV